MLRDADIQIHLFAALDNMGHIIRTRAHDLAGKAGRKQLHRVKVDDLSAFLMLSEKVAIEYGNLISVENAIA